MMSRFKNFAFNFNLSHYYIMGGEGAIAEERLAWQPLGAGAGAAEGDDKHWQEYSSLRERCTMLPTWSPCLNLGCPSPVSA